MIVENRSGKDLPIPELKKIVPANGKRYVIPYNVAVKYKSVLTPIQMSNNMSPPVASQPVSQSSVSQASRIKMNMDVYVPQPEANIQMTEDEKQEHINRLAGMLGETIDIAIVDEVSKLPEPMKFISKQPKNENLIQEEAKKPSANKGKTRAEILAKAERDRELIIATYKEGTLKSMYAISKALGFSILKVKSALEHLVKEDSAEVTE